MKYKINRNRPPLTDGEFTSTRDFNKVLKGYRALKIPFYRSGKFLTGGSAIVVAVAVGLIMLFGDEQDKPDIGFITPPIAQAAISSDTFIVEADSATEINYKTGSKLHIPLHAFKDAAGNLIKGKVEIRYREFHDQKDIFLSGIPMAYDSADSKYIFESAGMMEITAYQNGKPLLTNPEKPIRVDMVSNTAEDRYNTYYLDTEAKKWINLNQANLMSKQTKQEQIQKPNDSIRPAFYNEESVALSDSATSDQLSPAIIKCEQEVKKAVAAVQAVEKQKPVPVVKSDMTRSMFHIVVNEEDFPEIAMYKGVHFQVKDQKTFNPGSVRTEWEDVKLKKLSGLDYEVTFTKGTQVLKVVAAPVVDDKDLAAAQKVYDTKFAEYKVKLTEKKAAEEKAKIEFAAAQAQARKDFTKAMAQQEEMNKRRETTMAASQLIYRFYTVKKFGVYNCDCPIINHTDANVTAQVTDEKNEPLYLNEFCLVEKSINMVCSYHAVDKECLNFRFNSAKDNMIWGVTNDGKLAIVDVKSFKAQQAISGKVQFKFKVLDVKFNNSEEVKKYLEI